MVKTSVDEKKRILNQHRMEILNLIRTHGPLSRTDINNITNIRLTTVTEIVKELIENGIVIEVGSAESTGGRKPILLTINPTQGYIIGIDIRATNIRGALTNLRSQIIAHQQQDMPPENSGMAVVQQVKDIIRQLINAVPDKDKLLGVGIAVAGLVDSVQGIVIFSANIPGWRNIPLKQLIESEFNIPTAIEEKARSAALGERVFGCGRDIDDLIYYHIGMGIGAGIISHGVLYFGASQSAGEIGHTVIDETGPPCRCGNFGCLEAIASAKAIREHAIAALEKGVDSILNDLVNKNLESITSEKVYIAATRGDKLCRRILQEAGTHLGIGAANLVNILNPALLIIGGALTKAGEFILEPLLRTLQERSLSVSAQAVKIRVSELGDDAALLGATTLILKNIFTIPELAGSPHIK
ncbi:MAG: ROK family transcriptional regulator [bacterium]|nr:ROK family transcriptional regulator [bacterium]